MDLVQQKQEKIKILLKDALDIQEQVQEIAMLAEQVSEKFENIGDAIQRSSKSAAYFAKNLIKSTQYKGMAKGVGQMTEASFQIIGEGVKAFGEWRAKRKEKKLLEKLLPKKQELASNKMATIENLIPRIIKDKESIIEFCKNEASTQINFHDQGRFDLVYNDTKKIFEAYFIFEQAELLCRYLLDEFAAWLAGKHQSESEMLEADQIYFACVGKLIDWSALPERRPGLALPRRITIGGTLLLGDPQISEYAVNFGDVRMLAESATNSKLLSAMLPFTSNAKGFRAFFNRYTAGSKPLATMFRKKRSRLIWSMVAVVLVLLVSFYIY